MFNIKTDAYREYLESYLTKLSEVDHGLFYTIGMNTTEWRGANQRNRHLVARLAAHGFHSRLCDREMCNDPNENCICRRCGKACPKYHANDCDQVESIAKLADSE